MINKIGFTIVKQASNINWEYYFSIDPKISGVHESHSAFYTHTGKTILTKSVYDSSSELIKLLQILNSINPSGNYEICPVIFE